MLLVKSPEEAKALAKNPASVPTLLAELGVPPVTGVTQPAHE